MLKSANLPIFNAKMNFHSQCTQIKTSLDQTDLFDPYMGPLQVLPTQVQLDLGVLAMNCDSTL